MRSLVRLACVAAAALACAARADGPDDAPPPPAEQFGRQPGQVIQLLPGELFSASQAEHALPPLGYENGETWQALSCEKRCTLEAVKLVVHPAEVQPYDGEAMQGQTLGLDERTDGTLIALFRDLPRSAKKHPKTLLHAGMTEYPRPHTQGTMEIEIDALGGEPMRIVPRRTRDSADLKVYLESGKQRQQLGVVSLDGIAGFAGQARGAKLLQWAGDLDGDGRVDLIMSFSSRVGELVSGTLFLSSAAQAGELVHAVATFDYFPVESAGC